LAIAVDAADRRVEADACRTLAALDRRRGGTGSGYDERALAVARANGHRRGEALALIGLAHSGVSTGEHTRALDAGRAALDSARRAGYRLVEAEALAVLAAAELAAERPDDAAGHAREALDIHRKTGSPLGEERALALLGRATAAG